MVLSVTSAIGAIQKALDTYAESFESKIAALVAEEEKHKREQ